MLPECVTRTRNLLIDSTYFIESVRVKIFWQSCVIENWPEDMADTFQIYILSENLKLHFLDISQQETKRKALKILMEDPYQSN